MTQQHPQRWWLLSKGAEHNTKKGIIIIIIIIIIIFGLFWFILLYKCLHAQQISKGVNTCSLQQCLAVSEEVIFIIQHCNSAASPALRTVPRVHYTLLYQHKGQGLSHLTWDANGTSCSLQVL